MGSSSGNVLGTVVGRTVGNGDYEFVKVTNSSYSIINKIFAAGYFYNVTSYSKDPAVSNIVSFYGNATGSISSGSIIARDVSVSYYYGLDSHTVNGLSKVSISSGGIHDGDSGGPVFIPDGYNVRYCGLISGSDTAGNYLYFCPYLYPYNAGFRVLTN